MLRRLVPLAALAAGLALASAAPSPARAQDAAELVVRLNRLENQSRAMAGQIEQLQFENRQLKDQVRRFQEDVDFRLQERGGRAGAGGGTGPGAAPARAPARRGDAFDPDQNPRAPGTPQTLGGLASAASGGLGGPSSLSASPPGASPPVAASRPPALRPPPDEDDDEDVPPRGPDRPINLSPSAQSPRAPGVVASPGLPPAAPGPGTEGPRSAASPTTIPSILALPPTGLSGNPDAVAPRATAGLAPPSVAAAGGEARGAYDAAFAAFGQRQYEQAEMGFRAFLQAHPRDRLAPDATYYLGETYLQRNRAREAAEQFLKVSTDYAKSARAPDAMLKLGASLTALGAREQACATLAELERKYPGAAPAVRQGVEREQKRARCA